MHGENMKLESILYKSLKRQHIKILQHVSDHIGSIIMEWWTVCNWNYV